MTRRLALLLAAVVVVAPAASGMPALGLALRLAFVLASAAPIGAVLLLAIARLTGADWPSVAAPPRVLPLFVPVAFVVMLSATGAALPAHLATWEHPLFVAVRAALTVAALAWAGARLRGGAGETFAGLTLALYAALVTPIAADWLLPAWPGHPVSAIGMMLFLLQFAAACAVGALRGEARARRDLALLMIAALLGLCYLGFVDYLVTWYGNLPARVPFHLAKSGWLALAAIVIGVGGTIGAVASRREPLAALLGLAGLALFALWWVGAGIAVALIAAAATSVIALGMIRWARHG